MSVCSQHLSILNPRVVVPVQSLELELNCSPTVDRSLTARLVTYRVLTQTRFVCLPDYHRELTCDPSHFYLVFKTLSVQDLSCKTCILVLTYCIQTIVSFRTQAMCRQLNACCSTHIYHMSDIKQGPSKSFSVLKSPAGRVCSKYCAQSAPRSAPSQPSQPHPSSQILFWMSDDMKCEAERSYQHAGTV